MSAYDKIARLYDPWSRSVVEDVPFYLDEARRSGGPVLELAVGTGRIAIPIAASGIPVVGVDLSEGMLQVARERAAGGGRRRSTCATATCATRRSRARSRSCSSRSARCCTWRPMPTGALCCGAIKRHLAPDGRLIFDVFAPAADDIADTHGKWIEREPGIWERADWNEQTRTLVLRVRGRRAPRARCRSPGSRCRSGASCSTRRASRSRRSTAGSTARLARRRGLDLGLPSPAELPLPLVERDRA